MAPDDKPAGEGAAADRSMERGGRDDSIVNIFVMNKSNVGDWYCAPMRYFPFKKRVFAHFGALPGMSGDRIPRNIILGGGGLLNPVAKPHFETLTRHRSEIKKLIAWGIGSNVHYRTEDGFTDDISALYPPFIEMFDLFGARDFGTEHRWVPCASCMHPAFNTRFEIKNPIVLYEHEKVRIEIDGFPRMDNSEMDLRKVSQFLGSSETVITNSYHGVYWATLLGKRVVAIPFSSRFHGFKHQPRICTHDNWKKGIEKTETFPDALDECRRANVAFFCDVAKEFDFNI